MKKVITYGTYDLLHYGHINLLKRAKELGDYLIVGITSDDFDKARGKINVQQSLMERIAAVKATGIADEIVIEEYEGQKIDDIKHYDVDIFTVGSDWIGKFDYLKQYCDVVYLDRTQGISSTTIRSTKGNIRLGIVGDTDYINKFASECLYVNGLSIAGVCTHNVSILSDQLKSLDIVTDEYDEFIKNVDAVYIRSHPGFHYQQIKKALKEKKHVMCESPLSLSRSETIELFDLARKQKCVLMEGLKTAYSTAYSRLLLLVKAGKIGDVVSVDATCTRLKYKLTDEIDVKNDWNGICEWGPTAMLPIFQILGIDIAQMTIATKIFKEHFDLFTNIHFVYKHAVGNIKIGEGIKSEGELIVTGTEGYIYVPSPWWKTDYFEIRYENQTENKRYFYQLEGEGIRYELVAFLRQINMKYKDDTIGEDVSKTISNILEDFYRNKNVIRI